VNVNNSAPEMAYEAPNGRYFVMKVCVVASFVASLTLSNSGEVIVSAGTALYFANPDGSGKGRLIAIICL
jgi:hypothetical protein